MGHVLRSASSRLYSTHPFLQTSIQSYFSPNLQSMLEAIPSLLGREFGVGRMTFDSRCSNSFMHAFVTLCVRHTFMNMSVVSNLDRLEPQYKGVVDSSLSAVAFCVPAPPSCLGELVLSSMSGSSSTILALSSLLLSCEEWLQTSSSAPSVRNHVHQYIMRCVVYPLCMWFNIPCWESPTVGRHPNSACTHTCRNAIPACIPRKQHAIA